MNPLKPDEAVALQKKIMESLPDDAEEFIIYVKGKDSDGKESAAIWVSEDSDQMKMLTGFMGVAQHILMTELVQSELATKQ